MKKRLIRILLIVLALSNVLLLCSCKSKKNEEETTEAVSTEAEVDYFPSLPDDLNYNGKAIRVAYCNWDMLDSHEVVGEAGSGNLIWESVYARNIAVEERLNIKFEFIDMGNSPKAFAESMQTQLGAGTDSCDIMNMQQFHAMSLINNGWLANMRDAEYIDYSRDWWSTEYMEEIHVHDSKRYLLAGDISLTQMGNTSCMYFNKNLFAQNFGNADDLYQQVIDGKWTYDALMTYAKATWIDLNNDSATDESDILGLVSTTVSMTDHYTYTAGYKMSTRNNEGKPVFIDDHSHNVDIVNKIHQLYYQTNGVLVTGDENHEQDTKLVDIFKEGSSLFYGNRFYSAMYFVDMKDEYGIVPFPKYDENQENYYGLVHNGAGLSCVPYTIVDTSCVSAVLEAMCSANSFTVMPNYYETVLKSRYSQDATSGEMIDIIHDNVITDFVYANNENFTTSVTPGTITRTLMNKQSSNYSGCWASIADAAKKQLTALTSNTNS